MILIATNVTLVALRMLRLQPRLLVEGGAGTGKTVLAMAHIARRVNGVNRA